MQAKPEKTTETKHELVSIGTAAERAGVSRQSLQYYLMVGVVTASEVSASGRRMFDAEAIERIRLIRKLNQSGYTLRAIRELFIERGTLHG